MAPSIRAAWLAAALIAGAAPPAGAHIVLKEATAVSGTYHMVTFRVPHGCGPSPTVAISVAIPDGIIVAKPMPKPGWRIDIALEPLVPPVPREGGMATERPKAITWTGGPLPDAYVDEFSIMLRLPARTGLLWFPVVQTCTQGETRWIEVPPAGKTARDMRHPPPNLMLTPAPSAGTPRQ